MHFQFSVPHPYFQNSLCFYPFFFFRFFAFGFMLQNTRRLISRQSQAATSNIHITSCLASFLIPFLLGFLYSRNQKANWFGKEKMISLILIGKFQKRMISLKAVALKAFQSLICKNLIYLGTDFAYLWAEELLAGQSEVT